MKTYICKAEISVKVEAENESDAILKVSNKKDLPAIYWEVEQLTNHMNINDYTTTLHTLKAMHRDKEQQIKDEPKESMWANEKRQLISAIELVKMEQQSTNQII